MRHDLVRWAGTLMAVGALVALPACDRDDHDDHEEFASLEVIDQGQASQPVVATWTHDGGWEGQLPSVSLSSANQRIVLGFRAYAEDGDEFTLSETGENSIRYRLDQGATEGILNMELDDEELFHGDHVHIYGLAQGITQIRFLFWHDDHADAETTGISISVVP